MKLTDEQGKEWEFEWEQGELRYGKVEQYGTLKPIDSNNLRTSIEKILNNATKLEKTPGVFGKSHYELDHEETTDQILSLLEGKLPKERERADATLNMTAEEVCTYDGEVTGWNACLQEIRSKMK